MFGILYKFYSSVKKVIVDYFYPSNSIMITNISDENQKKIEDLQNQINELKTKVNIEKSYKCLKNLEKSFSKESSVDNILNYLNNEEQIIYNNRNNLQNSLDMITKNTYVINLKRQFLIIKEIEDIKTEIKNIQES